MLSHFVRLAKPMLPSPTPQQTASLPLIECGLAAIAVALAFLWPRLASGPFGRVEKVLGDLAQRRRLAVVLPGLTFLLLRIAMLPLAPIPLPFIPDDFSFLLACDTYASGHLANPTPAMWMHFESFHIDMHPTYISMYFPAQGLLLAAGKLVFGHPWFGVLLSGALMCSAICWMLQAWLPPAWALLGSMLAVVRIGLFSYWVNTYTGGATIAAIGGALVLGALPRYTRSMRRRDALLLAIGIVLLMISRPYEGMLLCLPVMVFLIRWSLKKDWIGRRVLFRSAALPVLLIVTAGSWLAYYNHHVFGNSAPAYRHAVLADFYEHEEMEEYVKLHRPYGFFSQSLIKGVRAVLFFAGFALALPLIMIRRTLMDRRIRFLIICALVLAPGMMIEIFLIPHYLAPFTVVFYAIGLQCMRHLRVWRPEGRPVGIALVRASVLLCVGLAGIRLAAKPLHIEINAWPASNWSGMWYGPEHFGVERAEIQARLSQLPGKHLVIVRYSSAHYPLNEWVYNSPDVDKSKIIWSRDMDQASNEELIHYYHDRRIWLVQPDVSGNKLQPYPAPIGIHPFPRELASLQENPASQ